jgi:hypothetical protein
MDQLIQITRFMHLQAPLSPLRSSLPRLPQLARRITLRIRASAAAQIAVRPLQDTRMARLFAMDTSLSRKTGLRASSGPGSGSCSASRLFRFIRTRYVGFVTTFIIALCVSFLWTKYADYSCDFSAELASVKRDLSRRRYSHRPCRAQAVLPRR